MIHYRTRLEMIHELPVGLFGAEIGVQRGDFSAEMLTTRLGKLHLVDCWRPTGATSADPANIDEGGHEENYRFTLARFVREIAEGRVVVHRATSLVAAKRFADASLGFAYLDAAHDYESVLADLIHWAPKIEKGGALCGHDYTSSSAARRMGFAVIEAVSDFCEACPWELVAITDEEWPSFMLKRLE